MIYRTFERLTRFGRTLAAILAVAAIPAVSSAGIINGAFNNNLNPWIQNGAVAWVPDAPAPNGHARLQGAGEISQLNWQCGETPNPNETCLVTFRYRADAPAANNVLRVTFGPAGAAGANFNFGGTGGVWAAGTMTSFPCGRKDITFSQFSSTVVEIDDVVDRCVPVPEPSSLAALGVLGFGFLKRRRAR